VIARSQLHGYLWPWKIGSDELGLNEGLPMKAHHGMVENYDEYNEKLSLKSIQC